MDKLIETAENSARTEWSTPEIAELDTVETETQAAAVFEGSGFS